MGDIESWLAGLGLTEYAAVFAAEKVDLEVLPELTESDLEKLGIPLGHRKKLLKAISTLTPVNPPAGEWPPSTMPRAGLQPTVASIPERRQLTVMFCDLVGSAALSVRFDPEDLREIIIAYQTCCEEVIQRFHGYVARYMGDGVLVYFGYPQAQEDDAERALRAGLEIVAAVKTLRPRPNLVLQTRVGIATGEVVVGDLIGEGMARESAVIGSTPNLAARLQSLAEPDSVVIAEGSRRLTGRLFDYADVGCHFLKGFEQPVQVWRVVAERRVASRFEAIHAGATTTPLVGRERELERLQRCWRRAATGAGQVVMVTGEPGIGKSRLFQTLRQQLADESYTLLRYYGSPNYRNSALYPITNQLTRAARLGSDDGPDQRLDKLEAMLAQAVDDVERLAPLFAALLSIPSQGRYPPLPLDAQQQKEKTIAALLDQLAGLASRQPVLVLFEDLHWVDPTTLELLQRAVDRVHSLPVLLVMTCRPEFDPPWPAPAHATTLTLGRLSHAKRKEMLQALTGGKSLPPPLLAQLVAKTDGIPLFIEELTATVLQAGCLRDAGDRYTLDAPLPALAVPSTLQDSLMARLDRLGPAKKIAQTGAVIGREFSAELLAAVAPGPVPALRDDLEHLVGADLIHRRKTSAGTLYAFKHALVQDTAYNSLLRDARKTLHARVAQALEAGFPDTVESHPELLAQHYTRADQAANAIPYWGHAGQRAAERSATVEAMTHLAAGLELLRKLPVTVERRHQELQMEVLRAGILRATKGISAPETGHCYVRVRELCQELGETEPLFPTLNGLYAYYLVRANYDQALEIAQQLLALSQEQTDVTHGMIGHRAMGAVLLHMGRLQPACRYLEQALALYDPAVHTSLASVYGTDHAAITSGFLGMVYWLLGYPERALAVQQSALQHARELRHAHSIAQVLTHLSLVRLLRREYGDARDTAQELLRISEEYVFPFMAVTARFWMQWAEVAQAPDAEGVRRLQQAAQAWWATGAGNYRPFFLTVIGELRGCVGPPAAALESLAEARAWMRQSGECWAEAELYRVQGVLSVPGRAAEDCLQQALAVARSQGARMWELRTAVSLAELWRDQGQEAAARELLAAVLDNVDEGADSVDMMAAKALLAGLTAG